VQLRRDTDPTELHEEELIKRQGWGGGPRQRPWHPQDQHDDVFERPRPHRPQWQQEQPVFERPRPWSQQQSGFAAERPGRPWRPTTPAPLFEEDEDVPIVTTTPPPPTTTRRRITPKTTTTTVAPVDDEDDAVTPPLAAQSPIK
jgi:hypothetical protein